MKSGSLGFVLFILRFIVEKMFANTLFGGYRLTMTFFEKLGVTTPVIQAPMAGVSTSKLAAAVSAAGGLGSIGVGATNAAGARKMIEDIRARTDRAFNVNVFVHQTARPDAVLEDAWLDAMRPLFQKFGVDPPTQLRAIYKSFLDDDDMFDFLLETAPPVISFHFGVPRADQVRALKDVGCMLAATATNLEEGQALSRAGIDVIVAQGSEAGGHRGVFDPDTADEMLSALALTRLLGKHVRQPIISAGGIMDGAGIRAALNAGAIGAQLGTAFIACPESSADTAYREALKNADALQTIMTSAISGRPARSLVNSFTEWGSQEGSDIPDYPIAYDAGKALNQAAKAKGYFGFGAQWAGEGVSLLRPMPAGDLLTVLDQELMVAK